jgi:hypothetical protein
VAESRRGHAAGGSECAGGLRHRQVWHTPQNRFPNHAGYLIKTRVTSKSTSFAGRLTAEMTSRMSRERRETFQSSTVACHPYGLPSAQRAQLDATEALSRAECGSERSQAEQTRFHVNHILRKAREAMERDRGPIQERLQAIERELPGLRHAAEGSGSRKRSRLMRRPRRNAVTGSTRESSWRRRWMRSRWKRRADGRWRW